MNRSAFTFFQLGWQLSLLLVILIWELVAGLPILSIMLLWRLATRLRWEQEILIALIFAVIVATFYMLSVTVVWLILATGLFMKRVRHQVVGKQDWDLLGCLLASSLFLGWRVDFNMTFGWWLTLSISSTVVLFLANVLHRPRHIIWKR